MNELTPLLLDSVTDANPGSAGSVLVCGSHGGLYVAFCASQAALRAVMLNDAGVGFQNAGIQGVLALADIGMAAVALSHLSCRIGSAIDAWNCGRVSTVNSVAQELGVQIGMTAMATAKLLDHATLQSSILAEVKEGRVQTMTHAGQSMLLLDSASLVVPEDIDKIIVTGSHGGLVGDDPSRALKTRASVAVFNDAGIGKDGAGISRLPVLDQMGVAAVTVSHASARIGDAQSTYNSGVISHLNKLAKEQGAAVGGSIKHWLQQRSGASRINQ